MECCTGWLCAWRATQLSGEVRNSVSADNDSVVTFMQARSKLFLSEDEARYYFRVRAASAHLAHQQRCFQPQPWHPITTFTRSYDLGLGSVWTPHASASSSIRTTQLCPRSSLICTDTSHGTCGSHQSNSKAL